MKLAIRILLVSLCLAGASPAWAQDAKTQAQRGVLGSRVFDPAPEQAKPAATKPRTDAEIRQWYTDQVAKIPELNAKWLEEGLSAEARAKRAYAVRHKARLDARAMMSSQTAVRALRARDRVKYGNPDGPSFEYLVKRNKAKGLTGDAVFEAIIGSARRTNKAVNDRLGVRSSGRE
jgi:hypothetical protein